MGAVVAPASHLMPSAPPHLPRDIWLSIHYKHIVPPYRIQDILREYIPRFTQGNKQMWRDQILTPAALCGNSYVTYIRLEGDEKRYALSRTLILPLFFDMIQNLHNFNRVCRSFYRVWKISKSHMPFPRPFWKENDGTVNAIMRVSSKKMNAPLALHFSVVAEVSAWLKKLGYLEPDNCNCLEQYEFTMMCLAETVKRVIEKEGLEKLGGAAAVFVAGGAEPKGDQARIQIGDDEDYYVVRINEFTTWIPPLLMLYTVENSILGYASFGRQKQCLTFFLDETKKDTEAFEANKQNFKKRFLKTLNSNNKTYEMAINKLECHKVSPTGGNIYPTLATLDALVRARNCIEGAVARSSTVGQQGMGGGDDVRNVTYTSTSEYEELLWRAMKCEAYKTYYGLVCIKERYSAQAFQQALLAGHISKMILRGYHDGEAAIGGTGACEVPKLGSDERFDQGYMDKYKRALLKAQVLATHEVKKILFELAHKDALCWNDIESVYDEVCRRIRGLINF